MAWPTEPLNIWAAEPFWSHVESVMKYERQYDPTEGPTDDEMVQAYLMAWVSMALPAGNA